MKAGKIAVLWADTELIREVAQDQQKMVLGMTASFGEIDPGTAMVYLNSDEIFKKPELQKKMWETVIHELVHASLDITCADFEPHPFDVIKGDSYSGGHGFEFRSILNVIFFRVEVYMGGPMTDVLSMGANNDECNVSVGEVLAGGRRGSHQWIEGINRKYFEDH